MCAGQLKLGGICPLAARLVGRWRTERGCGEPEHDEERQPRLGLARQMVVAIKGAHCHNVEGEECADGDQVEEAVEGREEGDDGCAAYAGARSVSAQPQRKARMFAEEGVSR